MIQWAHTKIVHDIAVLIIMTSMHFWLHQCMLNPQGKREFVQEIYRPLFNQSKTYITCNKTKEIKKFPYIDLKNKDGWVKYKQISDKYANLV